MVIISRCTCILNHGFKYLTIEFINYTSIKLKLKILKKERVMKKRRKTRRKENMKECKNRTQTKKRKQTILSKLHLWDGNI